MKTVYPPTNTVCGGGIMKVIFFYNLGIFSQIWEKHLIFALGIGADIRPQNRPRKIPVLINTWTTGKLNRSIMPPSLFNESSDFLTVFFRASHKIKEWKRISVFYYFQEQFHIFKGNFTDSRTIPGQMALF